MNSAEGMFKVDDAAKQLMVHPLTIRRWMKSGKIQFQKKERGANAFLYFITKEEIERVQEQLLLTRHPRSLSVNEHADNEQNNNVQANVMESGLIDIVKQQTTQIGGLQKDKDELQKEKEALHKELRAVGETATTFQVKNEMLQEQNELLQGQVQKLLPPPAEEVEPEPPPRRHWYWLWLRAT